MPFAGAIAHVAIDAALGILVLAAYRHARRTEPTAAAIMAAGIILRASVGLALFWTSYLDLPAARHLHTGDGFWALAVDARIYYHDAIALSNGSGQTVPLFVRILSIWMRLVGESPASGLFLNLALYTLLAYLVIRACRPFTDTLMRTVCVVTLIPFTFAPVLLVHGTQPLKDDLFMVAVLATCLAVRALFVERPLPDDAARASGWAAAGPLLVLAAVSQLMSGIRLYATASICAALLPAALLYLGYSDRAVRWRNLAIAAAAMAAIASGPLAQGSSKIRRWLTSRPSHAAQISAPVHAQSSTYRLPLLNTLARVRRMSVQGRGGLNLVADPEDDVSIVRATVAGAAVVFVPVSVAKALGWVHVAGGRGLLWITDVDTVLLDVFAIGAIVLLAAHRDRARPHAPFVWFVVALAIGATLLFAFTMTNYGTLVRMRVMIATPLWLLPLALSPRREDDQPSNQQA